MTSAVGCYHPGLCCAPRCGFPAPLLFCPAVPDHRGCYPGPAVLSARCSLPVVVCVRACPVSCPLSSSTFPGTEMPPIGSYSPGAICPQLGGSCSKLAFWLQVRGTMCSEPDWRPQFTEGLSVESESAAYEATLDRHNVCIHQKKENEEYTKTLRANMMGQFLFLLKDVSLFFFGFAPFFSPITFCFFFSFRFKSYQAFFPLSGLLFFWKGGAGTSVNWSLFIIFRLF